MKRPLAVIGFSYVAALAVALFIGPDYSPLFALASAVTGLISLLPGSMRKNGKAAISCISMAAAFLMLSSFTGNNVSPVAEYNGKVMTVQARLCGLPYEHNGIYYYMLETIPEKSPDIGIKTKMHVSSDEFIPADAYDIVSLDVRLSKNDVTYRDISRNIYLRGTVIDDHEINVTKAEDFPPYYYALMLRRTVRNTVFSQYNKDDAALVCAITIGDKTELDDETVNTFRYAGLSNLTAVSGFHLTVFVRLMLMVLELLTFRRKRLAGLLCTVPVFIFMAVAGFTPSVVRAGIMQILFLLGCALFQKSDGLNSLGFAAFVICIINPYAAADPSFVMSFSATLGLILYAWPITKYFSELILAAEDKRLIFRKPFFRLLLRAVLGVVNIISVSVTAAVFSMPAAIGFFGCLSIYSVVSNVILCVPAGLLIILSFLGIIAGFVPLISGAAVIFTFPAWMMIRSVSDVAALTASWPFARLELSRGYVPLCISAGIIAAVIFYLKFRNKIRAFLATVTGFALLFSAGAVCDHIITLNSCKLSVFDTGSGLFVLYSDGDENALLFCGGELSARSRAIEYLDRSTGGHLDYLLLCDRMRCNTGYAGAVMDRTDIDVLQYYDKKRWSDEMLQKIDKAGMTYGYKTEDNYDPVRVVMRNSDISVIRGNDCTAVFIECSGVSILVCPYYCDCAYLPEEWRCPDMLVINALPDNYELLSAGSVIISDKPVNSSLSADLLRGQCRNIDIVDGGQAVTARIWPDQRMVFRRESNWLS